jgi:hypothetical protein
VGVEIHEGVVGQAISCVVRVVSRALASAKCLWRFGGLVGQEKGREGCTRRLHGTADTGGMLNVREECVGDARQPDRCGSRLPMQLSLSALPHGATRPSSADRQFVLSHVSQMPMPFLPKYTPCCHLQARIA